MDHKHGLWIDLLIWSWSPISSAAEDESFVRPRLNFTDAFYLPEIFDKSDFSTSLLGCALRVVEPRFRTQYQEQCFLQESQRQSS